MDKYDEKALEVLKPFCRYCLPSDASVSIAAFGRECAAQSFEDDAKHHEEMAKKARKRDAKESASAHEVSAIVSHEKAAALRAPEASQENKK